MAKQESGRVAGKVELVTGAAKGLGLEAARRLATEGAAVLLTDLDSEGIDAATLEIRQDGGRAQWIRHDVSREADWQAAVQAAQSHFGALHVLVNNAGIAQSEQPIFDTSLADWRRILAINLDGVFLGLHHAGPLIAQSGGGSVINLSSVLGKVGAPNASGYCASKGGVALLSKAAALEWAELGIRVNSVHPGFIETPMTTEIFHQLPDGNIKRGEVIAAHALSRLGRAREVADAILFLASDESSFMTGSELVVDGGYTAH